MKPIALTAGEPGGVGLELAVKAHEVIGKTVPFFLIADPRHMPDGARFVEITDPADAVKAAPETLPILPHAFAGRKGFGQADPANAQGVIDVIARAVDLVQTGQASAICTNPIHKKALQDGAAFPFPGHTEFLAHLAGVKRVVMMLAAPQLKVVPTTIHIALEEVKPALTTALLEETIRITDAALRRYFGVAAPRLAIAGLNPHAGESGAMGREEIELIAPLVARLQQEGLVLLGPMSADTMFHARARQTYDAAICMYHDQALIPIKTLDFDHGVNVTLGLPFVRTSPDHGTAFDIAGKGIASASSLIEALTLADQMARSRQAA